MLSFHPVSRRIRIMTIGAVLAGTAVVGVPGAAFGFDLSPDRPYGPKDDPWDRPGDPWDTCSFQAYCEHNVNVLDGKGPGNAPNDPKGESPYQARTWKYEHTDADGRAWYRNTAKGQENVWKSTPDAIAYTKLWWVRTSESIIDTARAGKP